MGNSICTPNEIVPPAGNKFKDDSEQVKQLQNEVKAAREAQEEAQRKLAELQEIQKKASVESAKKKEVNTDPPPDFEPPARPLPAKNVALKDNTAEMKALETKLEASEKKMLVLEQQMRLLQNISFWSVVASVPKVHLEGSLLLRVQIIAAKILSAKLKSVREVLSSLPSPEAKTKELASHDQHVVITVVDDKGRVLGQTGRTPAGNMQAPLYIICPEDYVKNPEEGRYFVFFQIMHEKQKGAFGKTSTRCFAFHDMSKLSRDGKKYELQLYKKPTDFTRDPASIVALGKDCVTIVLSEVHDKEDEFLPDSYIH